MRKLKKFLPISILILFSLTLGGCLPKKETEKEPFAESTGETFEEGGETVLPQGKGEQSYTFKALKAAIALGIPLKCGYQVGDVEYEGYVKGKQWRGKIQTSDGKTGEVIMKDNCMYSWTEETKMGVKMCFEEDMWETDEYQEAAPGIEYHCLPAAVTDAQFNPPSGINFMDISQMGQQGMGA